MPGQQTFELIPTTLVNPSGYKPPMTSKQVKKAYQKANQIKGITRAELRRLEVEELARHRREYQKEKAAAKARAARESKAAKALAEAQLRKETVIQSNETLVRTDKTARSRSQTSISSFAKCDRQKIGIKSKEEDSRLCARQSNEVQQKEDTDNNCLDTLLTKRVADEVESSESEFDGFPFCSQLEIIVASIDCKNVQNQPPISHSQAQILKSTSSQIADIQYEPQNLSDHRQNLQGSKEHAVTSHTLERQETNSQLNINHLQNQQEKCKADEEPARILCLAHQDNSQSMLTKPCMKLPKLLVPKEVCSSVQNKSAQFQEKSRVKLRKTAEFATKLSLKSDSSPPVISEFPNEISNDCRSSLTNTLKQSLDDDDDDIDVADFPSNTQILTEINSSGSTHSNHPYTITSQISQVLKLEAIGDVKNNSKILLTTCCETESTSIVPMEQDEFDDLSCTQDLILLSQELRKETTSVSLDCQLQVTKHVPPEEIPSRRKRFFEEKEEDLLKAALYESEIMATNHSSITVPIKSPIEQELLLSTATSNINPDVAPPSISSPATDYGIDDLGGDDWEELSALC